MVALEITAPRQLDAKELESFRAIYLDSFPPHERADFSFLARSIAAGERWLFTAARGDALLGFAIVVPAVTRAAHLLEYLAVARAARKGRIGSRLLAHVIHAIRDAPSALGMLIEVEPDDEGDADERALRARRIAFYARHGARVIDAARDYRVPRADGAGTLRMKLLWLPIDARTDAPQGDALRERIVGILRKSYGVDE